MRPSSIIRLHPTESHVLRVFIWKSHDDMYYALRNIRHEGEDNYGGYFGVKETRVFVEDNGSQTILSKNVGDIHLVLNHFGAGVFAHELQHFMMSWIDNAGWHDILGEYWEPIALLSGDITNEFWTKFYEKYQETTP